MEEKRELSGERVFQVELSCRVVEIWPMYEDIHALCREYSLPEFTEQDITVALVPADIEREATAAQREDEKSGIVTRHSPGYLETIGVYRQIVTAMTLFDTVLMHGSVVATAGQGYMFTAPSGTGKSTRTKLWLDNIRNSIVINGDKPLLKVTDEAVYAYGTPWCGKEGWNTNASVPLRAIFLLERSEGGNRIEEVSFAEAFPTLLRQTYRPDDADARRKTLRILQQMAGKVKVYRFISEPTAEAVKMAWERAQTSV